MTKALVIGFGSIGRRHAAVLEEFGIDVAIVSRRDVDHPHAFRTIDAALTYFDPDYIVVASRTNEHLHDVAQLANLGFAGVLLIEKPLFHHVSVFPDNTFRRVHVAFNMRFHPLLSALTNAAAARRIFAIHAYVGQYLPNWRPESDYRSGYSAIRAQGGGVLRDLSHELDMTLLVGGPACNVTALGGKFSHLEIDSDDVFSILVQTTRCPTASISMNYLDTKLHREFVVHTDEGTLRANLVTCELSDGTSTRYIPAERNESYIAMHRAAINGDTSMLCSLQEAEQVQHLIAAVERASAGPEWVSLSPE